MKSIAIHLPFLSRYFCKSMPSRWQKVVYTPRICITIRLPFVSGYFCRSIGVRARWNTPNIWRLVIWIHKSWKPFGFGRSQRHLSCLADATLGVKKGGKEGGQRRDVKKGGKERGKGRGGEGVEEGGRKGKKVGCFLVFVQFYSRWWVHLEIKLSRSLDQHLYPQGSRVRAKTCRPRAFCWICLSALPFIDESHL